LVSQVERNAIDAGRIEPGGHGVDVAQVRGVPAFRCRRGASETLRLKFAVNLREFSLSRVGKLCGEGAPSTAACLEFGRLRGRRGRFPEVKILRIGVGQPSSEFLQPACRRENHPANARVLKPDALAPTSQHPSPAPAPDAIR